MQFRMLSLEPLIVVLSKLSTFMILSMRNGWNIEKPWPSGVLATFMPKYASKVPSLVKSKLSGPVSRECMKLLIGVLPLEIRIQSST